MTDKIQLGDITYNPKMSHLSLMQIDRIKKSFINIVSDMADKFGNEYLGGFGAWQINDLPAVKRLNLPTKNFWTECKTDTTLRGDRLYEKGHAVVIVRNPIRKGNFNKVIFKADILNLKDLMGVSDTPENIARYEQASKEAWADVWGS